MSKKISAWALLDSRIGNRNQVLGILNNLGFNFKKLEINYNKIACLPNFIIQILGGFSHIKNPKDISFTPYPTILIACGRRTAPLALNIYRNLPVKPFLVQLMYPRFTYNKKFFDMIIVPEHDSTPRLNNLYKFIGTPNQLEMMVKKKKITKKFGKPIILVLIGGDHGKYKINIKSVIVILEKVFANLDRKEKVFISTSRRTSVKIIDYIQKNYSNRSEIYDIYHPNISSRKNPITEVMIQSKEIIVTGDSMSMVSEACSLSKPVRIFYNSEICSPKQSLFCRKLIVDGYAFNLDNSKINKKNIKVLETSKNISDKIREVFFSKHGQR